MADEQDSVVECWAPIPGHDGYEASDQGRIRSLDRQVWCGTHWRKWKGRILKPCRKESGHLYVVFPQKKNKQIHCLVMLTFVGLPPPGTEVCHFDGNPNNNRLGNLRYDTSKGNKQDTIRNGTVARGSKLPHTKLTPNNVITIRNSSLSNRQLAKAYGVSRSLIEFLKRRVRWTWLDDVKNTEEQSTSPRMDKGVD